MKHIILFSSILICSFAFGQNNPSNSWKHFNLENDSLGKILIHIDTFQINKRKPLLVFLEGSGNFPIFFRTKKGNYSTGVTLNTTKYRNDFHILLISKPNTPFVDSLSYSSSNRGFYPENSIYKKYYSLNWRANATSLAIDFTFENLKIDSSKIIVMGHSEGSQVAPAVAVLNSKVTHVVSMMGNALNQFYDFIINERVLALIGKIPSEQAQNRIDSLYLEYEKIYKAPKSTDKEWYGETYYKWSSFTLNSPIDNMLKLDIPILYIGGGEDTNQNIINMDYARLKFLSLGKQNLTYKVFPNLNHFFQERKTTAQNKIELVDHIDEVHDLVIKWVMKKRS